jgi:hypothetical protein
VVNHVKARGALGVIHRRDIHQRREFAGRIGFQEINEINQMRQRNGHIQLAKGNFGGQHRIGAGGGQMAGKAVQGF